MPGLTASPNGPSAEGDPHADAKSRHSDTPTGDPLADAKSRHGGLTPPAPVSPIGDSTTVDPPAESAPADPLHPGAGLPTAARCAVALLTALLHTGLGWFEPYDVGCDEGHHIQSAARLAAGQGLTVSWADRFRDLAEPEYHHQVAWPPLVSWLLALGFKLGLSIDGVYDLLRGLRFAAALLGAWAWIGLGCRLLPTGAAWLFAAAVPGLFFAGDFLYGPSHLYMWALMPVIAGGLIRGTAEGRLTPLLWAGAATLLAMSLRYSAIALLPAGGLAVLLLGQGSFLRRFAHGTVFALPATLTLGAYLLYNSLAGDALSWLDVATQSGGPWFEQLWRREPWTSFTAWGLGLEYALYKLRPSWEFGTAWWFAPWHIAVAAVAVVGFRLGRERFTSEQARLPAVALLMMGWLVALLGAMAVRQNPETQWTVIDQERYYSETMPLVGMALLLLFSAAVPTTAAGRLTVPVRPAGAMAWAMVAVFAVCAGRGLFHGVRKFVGSVRVIADRGVRTPHDLESFLRERVAASPLRMTSAIADDPDPGPHRVFDTFDGTVGRLYADDRIRARNMPHKWDVQSSANSRPTWVVAVVRWAWNRRNGEAEPWAITGMSLAVVRAYGLKPVGVLWDEGTLCAVYEGVVPPYAAGAVQNWDETLTEPAGRPNPDRVTHGRK